MESSDERLAGGQIAMKWERITTEAITSPPRRSVIKSLIGDLEKVLGSEFGEDLDKSIEGVKAEHLFKIQKPKFASDHLWLKAMLFTLSDLASQRWRLKYEKSHLFIQRPADQEGREGLRERLVARRNQQLREESVQQFIKGMEKWRLKMGARTSILSLMCDGRNLEKRLLDISQGVSEAKPIVEPYLQVATQDAVCEHTGLKLTDIWRYFRHTWSNPYESIPGRSMLILVRDASWPNHPVIGIAALSSAAVRLSARDVFMGWDTEHLMQDIAAQPTGKHSDWVLHVIQSALQGIYTADFVRDGIISGSLTEHTSDETLAALRSIASQQKETHHRLMEGGDYKTSKQPKNASDDDWEIQAQTPLFRAKRAAELANLLDLWNQVNEVFRNKEGSEKVKALVASSNGRDVLSRVIRVARSMSVGTAIADLTVCGAIAPYNHLAGGKLVAMLAASPEAVLAYRERYKDADSIIASSMAGRRINRPANLVFIGTTSLYGKRPNQYDRITFPSEEIGGKPNDEIRYHYIRDNYEGSTSKGATKGVGTFHFSPGTLRSLEEYSIAERGGWRVNNVFGEGTSPKMRAIREGMGAIGLEPEKVLTHGMGKCLYGVTLVRNLRDYLLGIDAKPDYLFSQERPKESSLRIATWWYRRWAASRADRIDVLESLRKENLVYPIRHRARVVMPQEENQQINLI